MKVCLLWEDRKITPKTFSFIAAKLRTSRVPNLPSASLHFSQINLHTSSEHDNLYVLIINVYPIRPSE